MVFTLSYVVIKQIDTVRSTLNVTTKYTPTVMTTQEEKTDILLENTVPKGIDLNKAVQDIIFVPTSNEKEALETQTTDNVEPTSSGDVTSSTTALPAQITVELIAKYLTPEDKSRIATKVLSSKLQAKEFKLPQYTNAPEAMCDVCEMPKLATKNGTIPDECFVCDALYKKIVKRAKKEEKMKKAAEVEAATDVNEKKSRMRAKEYEMERKQAKEWLRREKYRGMDWSASVPSIVRASRRKERRDAAKSSNCSSGTDSSPIQKELEDECRVLSTASYSDDSSAISAENGKKILTNEEKDEYDDLLDDECVRELQRKIHGSPFPIKNGTDPTDGKSEMKTKGSGVSKKENDAGVSYEEISQLYEEFEKEHKDVVDYARQRVGHRSGGRSSNRQEDSRRIRSSSAPSVSSFSESRDYEERRYYGRDRRHRDHHNYDSSDSMSELSYERDYHYRHGPRYSSHGGRYVDKERRSRRRPRGYRSHRHEHSSYHMKLDDSYSDEYLPRRRTRGARGARER